METNKEINKRKIWPAIIFVALFVLGAYWYLDVKKEAYLSIITDVVTEEERKLSELSTTLSNSGWYDERPIVSDCSQVKRARFDNLLSRLSSLSRSELTELDGIFDGCAFYFSTVQSVKVSNLKREVGFYNDQLRTMSVFSPEAEEKLLTITTWDEFVRLAEEQSDLVTELVTIQGEIIDLLIAFNSSESTAVKTLVSRAQEVRENIIFLEQKMGELRTSLLSS